jgi:hypothetical protein
MSSSIFTSPEEAESAFYAALARADLDGMMAVWSEDEEVVCVHRQHPPDRPVGHPRIVAPALRERHAAHHPTEPAGAVAQRDDRRAHRAPARAHRRRPPPAPAHHRHQRLQPRRRRLEDGPAPRLPAPDTDNLHGSDSPHIVH